jgi:hypothetical protein
MGTEHEKAIGHCVQEVGDISNGLERATFGTFAGHEVRSHHIYHFIDPTAISSLFHGLSSCQQSHAESKESLNKFFAQNGCNAKELFPQCFDIICQRISGWIK